VNHPYEILGVSPTASDAEIRGRYLELVREFPPDRFPNEFRDIRAAYDDLRDPVRRLQRQLFDPSTTDSLDAIAKDLRSRLTSGRVPLEALSRLAGLP
jgi:curved DNA-binding protein CbpA